MLRLIEAATPSPVSLAEMKDHVEAQDYTDDDAKLQIFLDAATAFVAQRTSLVLAPAAYRLEREDWWGACLDIPLAPVREITAVTYLDEKGDEQLVSEALYRWYRTSEGARLELLDAFTAPAVAAERRDAVRVEIAAGFDDENATGAGDDPELVLPAVVKPAILMLAAAWYANREAVSVPAISRVPLGAETLINLIRVYR